MSARTYNGEMISMQRDSNELKLVARERPTCLNLLQIALIWTIMLILSHTASQKIYKNWILMKPMTVLKLQNIHVTDWQMWRQSLCFLPALFCKRVQLSAHRLTHTKPQTNPTVATPSVSSSWMFEVRVSVFSTLNCSVHGFGYVCLNLSFSITGKP